MHLGFSMSAPFITDGHVLAWTGHRPEKLGGYEPCNKHLIIQDAMCELMSEIEPDYVISGMALGVDTWAAELAIEMQIPFIAAVPFAGQAQKWSTQSQAHWQMLLRKAHKVVHVSFHFHASAFHDRNRWMVDNCDELAAVWDGTEGGTAHCYLYAQQMQRPLHLINPGEL